MRHLLPIILLAPAAALAWPVVVPQGGEVACVQITAHRVEVDVDPTSARATTEIELHVPQETAALVLLPEVATGPFEATLDGAALGLERHRMGAAADRMVELAKTRARPALIELVGMPVHEASVTLTAGRHVLRVVTTPFFDRDAATPHLVAPLRLLGTACHTQQVEAVVRLRTARPLGAVFTPFHDAEVSRPDVRSAELSIRGSGAHDLHLYLATTPDRRAAVAANLLSWRGDACDDAEAPGYMLVAAGPTSTEVTDAVPKDVILVIDRSGSMDGEKIAQVRSALGGILDGLGPDDRFDLVSFAGDVRSTFGRLVEAGDDDARAQAREVVAGLRAGGSTDIHGALLASLAELNTTGDHDRPRMLVFLTDGQATAGETNPERILSDVVARNELGARIFAFGVGNDVNTYLLDELGRRTDASTTYIRPGEDIDAALTAFYSAVQAPVVTDLALEAHGFAVRDVLPRTLPDLYVGSQLLLAARYDDAEVGHVELTGSTADDDRARFTVSGGIVRRGDAHAFLPRLWGSRRMAELLYEARQNGGEEATVDEIRTLAWRHGFVTRHTRFVAGEGGRVDAGYSNPTGDDTGEEAVGTSSDINEMSDNSNAGAYVGGDGAVPMLQVLDRTFVFEGVYWWDTVVPPEPDGVIDVAFGGPDWRALVDAGAGPMLAIGRNVVMRWRCRVVRVTDGEAVEDAPAPDALPPALVGPADDAEEMNRGPDVAEPPPVPPSEPLSESCAAGGRASGSGVWWALALLLLVRRRRVV